MQSPALASLLQRLRALREAHGLTQEAFAESCGLSYKHYQAVEAGRKHELRFSTLERLAKAYGIEIWQLLAPPFPKTRLARAPKALSHSRKVHAETQTELSREENETRFNQRVCKCSKFSPGKFTFSICSRRRRMLGPRP